MAVAVTVAETEAVTVAETEAVTMHVIPIQALFPHHHHPKRAWMRP